ncbi:hypothetical protein ACIQNU_03465 [Streptomyces sp. NPDC091292]|uniref:hypothetical protein n=1 Tax=Streptomyces sp. NPDC091292 TaxID=3365991 RepID=UPI003806D600
MSDRDVILLAHGILFGTLYTTAARMALDAVMDRRANRRLDADSRTRIRDIGADRYLSSLGLYQLQHGTERRYGR